MAGPPDRSHSGAMNTLSDEELRATRNHLIARGDELRDRVRRARLDLARAAIAVEDDDILEAIEQSALSELESIDVALERIEAGTFAKCDACGNTIPAERLRLVPHATRCWDCSG